MYNECIGRNKNVSEILASMDGTYTMTVFLSKRDTSDVDVMIMKFSDFFFFFFFFFFLKNNTPWSNITGI